MRRTIIGLLVAVALPTVVHAEEPKADKKPHLICRTAPAPTGSMRVGKRTCRTAEEWKARNRPALEYDQMGSGAPVRSQGDSQGD
jgi:hypothetical protein